jgi:formylglycine-generating enzyme required for sulfatase activity
MNQPAAMKKTIFALLLLHATLLHAQTRKDYAVFFPVSTYGNGWTQLPNTLTECKDLAGDLNSLYGFQTEVLPDKNKREIKTKLAELAARKYGPEDQLLLFFSMHGSFDEAGEAGCLCPAGAKTNDPEFDTWLLHTELRTLAARIPCEHILIVIDACYSGTFGGKRGTPKPDWETPDCQTNIQKALNRKTRYFIASGAKERTPAVSELAKKMRSALGGRYNGEDGMLSLKELLGVLSEAQPTPKDGEFAGDLGGSFVFVPKNGCGGTPAPTPPADPDRKAWDSARSQNTEEAYRFYLSTWASGRFRAEADQALHRLQEERVWQAAVQNGSKAAYEQYKASYCPGGLHCAEAEEKTKAPKVPDDGLVFVKGGTFTMGCTSEQKDCSDDEKPAHSVTVNDFYIGRYEVTQRLWKQVMGDNPSRFKNCDDCPVEQVSWEDVQAFLTKLNQQTGLRYRLPTEAEWEYAARGGGKQVLFGNGKNIIDPSEINFDASSYYKKPYSVAGTYRQKTVPVGSLNSPNALGLHDMSGNVWEWCADWYGADYYKNSPSSNPTGPTSGSYRVLRGGSWGLYPQYCRVAVRYFGAPGVRYNNSGFRLARTN